MVSPMPKSVSGTEYSVDVCGITLKGVGGSLMSNSLAYYELQQRGLLRWKLSGAKEWSSR